MTFEEMRADFIERRKGALSLPLTGLVNYSVAALLSLVIVPHYHNLVLTLCFWAILPVAVVIARLRGEQTASNPANPLFSLAKFGRLLALSTWSIHIPVWIYAPELFPLTVGIAFALHWIIFSWTVDHPVGFIHLALRISLTLLAWHLVPENRMGAVAAAVAVSYGISVWQLSRIDWRRRASREGAVAA